MPALRLTPRIGCASIVQRDFGIKRRPFGGRRFLHTCMDGLSTVRANTRNGAAEYVPDEKGDIIMDNSNHIPLNLQFFADPAPNGDGDPNGGGADDSKADPKGNPKNDPKADPKDDQPEIPSFSELLKDKGFQSEFDKRVNSAITTAKAKWDEEAKLSEAELAKKKQTEAEEKLSKREAELAARELRADMVTEIAKRGLPAALIEAVSLVDKDTASASLTDVEKAYRAAVQAGIDEKLKGTPPPDGAGAGAGTGKGVGDEIKSEMYGKK